MKQCLARDDRKTEKKGMFKVETFWLFIFFFHFLFFRNLNRLIWITVQCGSKEMNRNVKKGMQFLQIVNYMGCLSKTRLKKRAVRQMYSL